MMTRALDDPATFADLNRRLASLTPGTTRQWGTLTAHEMVCHLSDSFRGMLGERGTSPAPANPLMRQLVRLIALHTPLPWPQGVPTRPEVDPKRDGTRPADFAADRDALALLMQRFAQPGTTYRPHPMFGTLTRREWMHWGFRHVDHHFRQFGV